MTSMKQVADVRETPVADPTKRPWGSAPLLACSADGLGQVVRESFPFMGPPLRPRSADGLTTFDP